MKEHNKDQSVDLLKSYIQKLEDKVSSQAKRLEQLNFKGNESNHDKLIILELKSKCEALKNEKCDLESKLNLINTKYNEVVKKTVHIDSYINKKKVGAENSVNHNFPKASKIPFDANTLKSAYEILYQAFSDLYCEKEEILSILRDETIDSEEMKKQIELLKQTLEGYIMSEEFRAFLSHQRKFYEVDCSDIDILVDTGRLLSDNREMQYKFKEQSSKIKECHSEIEAYKNEIKIITAAREEIMHSLNQGLQGFEELKSNLIELEEENRRLYDENLELHHKLDSINSKTNHENQSLAQTNLQSHSYEYGHNEGSVHQKENIENFKYSVQSRYCQQDEGLHKSIEYNTIRSGEEIFCADNFKNPFKTTVEPSCNHFDAMFEDGFSILRAYNKHPELIRLESELSAIASKLHQEENVNSILKKEVNDLKEELISSNCMISDYTNKLKHESQVESSNIDKLLKEIEIIRKEAHDYKSKYYSISESYSALNEKLMKSINDNLEVNKKFEGLHKNLFSKEADEYFDTKVELIKVLEPLNEKIGHLLDSVSHSGINGDSCKDNALISNECEDLKNKIIVESKIEIKDGIVELLQKLKMLFSYMDNAFRAIISQANMKSPLLNVCHQVPLYNHNFSSSNCNSQKYGDIAPEKKVGGPFDFSIKKEVRDIHEHYDLKLKEMTQQLEYKSNELSSLREEIKNKDKMLVELESLNKDKQDKCYVNFTKQALNGISALFSKYKNTNNLLSNKSPRDTSPNHSTSFPLSSEINKYKACILRLENSIKSITTQASIKLEDSSQLFGIFESVFLSLIEELEYVYLRLHNSTKHVSDQPITNTKSQNFTIKDLNIQSNMNKLLEEILSANIVLTNSSKLISDENSPRKESSQIIKAVNSLFTRENQSEVSGTDLIAAFSLTNSFVSVLKFSMIEVLKKLEKYRSDNRSLKSDNKKMYSELKQIFKKTPNTHFASGSLQYQETYSQLPTSRVIFYFEELVSVLLGHTKNQRLEDQVYNYYGEINNLVFVESEIVKAAEKFGSIPERSKYDSEASTDLKEKRGKLEDSLKLTEQRLNISLIQMKE